MRALPGAAALAAVALLGACSSERASAPTTTGERIVVAELDDEPVEVTVDDGVPGWSPMWSPDGTTIAFLRGRSVWLMDADGRNPRRVPGSDGAERLVAWLAEPTG